jgi:hypothetical protein
MCNEKFRQRVVSNTSAHLLQRSSSPSGPEFRIGDMRTPHFVANATGMRSHAFVHAPCTTVPEPCQSRAIAVP